MKSVLRLACAIVVLSIGACAEPSITTPQPSVATPVSCGYVKILPLPTGGTLRDILVRDGKPVGVQDPTTPDDPTVRIVHGSPSLAQDVFETLRAGGTPIRSAVGKAVKRRDGAIVVYYEHDISSTTSVGSVTIFVFGKDIPVTQLRFYVSPPGIHTGLCALDGGAEG